MVCGVGHFRIGHRLGHSHQTDVFHQQAGRVSRYGHPCRRSNNPTSPLSADCHAARIDSDAAVFAPAVGRHPVRLCHGG